MKAIPPVTTPLPSRTDIPSATRGERLKTQVESFDQSLTRSRRESRVRDSIAADAPVAKSEREVKQRKTKTEDSAGPLEEVAHSTAESAGTTQEPRAEEEASVPTTEPMSDGSETPSSPPETDAPPSGVADVAEGATNQIAEMLMAFQTAASPQPVALTGGTAPVTSQNKAIQTQNEPTTAASTETGVLASTGVPTATESAGAGVVPVVAIDSASVATNGSSKRVVPTTESTSNVQQAQLPAASGEASVAPAGSPAAPQTTPGKEAIAAQFAQLPTGDDSGLRDDANVARVVRGMTSAIHQRGGSVTLRLTPPELGAVKIEMTVRDGVVNARFTAATESVRHLLTDQMAHLKSALDRQGLSVERIEVQSPAPQHPGGGSNRSMDDAGRDGRSAGEYTRQGGQREGARSQQGAQRDVFEEALAGATQ